MRITTSTRNRSPLLFAVVILGVAACSKSDSGAAVDTTMTPAAVVPVDSATLPPAAVQIAATQKAGVGTYLTDASGRSVYVFMMDKGDSSSCYDACAAAWPPFLGTGEAMAADTSVRANLLGTLKRRDGATQVTYKGAPLYYYEDDKKPGDITGQDKFEFGAKWYLVSPAGGKQEGKAKS